MDTEQVQKYLDETIKNLESYTLSETDQRCIDRDVADFIIRKIDRKGFRRKLTDTTKEKLRQKIATSIGSGQPVHFVTLDLKTSTV